MVQYLGGYKKGIAIELRKKGFSYDDIKNELNIPKSTVVYWVRDIKLEENQTQNLKNKQLETAKENSRKRAVKILKQAEEIRTTSIASINKISKRELWLIGIVLYWRQKFSSSKTHNLKKGVWFSSSDPNILNLFLRWLRDVGGVTNKELYLDIFMKKGDKKDRAKIINYWSGAVGIPSNNFKHFYYQNNKSKFGFLRIRVSASSMLARQIDGWIAGISKYYK